MVQLKDFSATLVSDTAKQEAAKCINKNSDKNSQLRKFYDELVMWHDMVFALQDPQEQNKKYEAVAPYIQMLRAKVAYAHACDEKVSENFRSMFDSVISGINSKEDLKHARMYMEAFMGFLKYERFIRKIND